MQSHNGPKWQRKCAIQKAVQHAATSLASHQLASDSAGISMFTGITPSSTTHALRPIVPPHSSPQSRLASLHEGTATILDDQNVGHSHQLTETKQQAGLACMQHATHSRPRHNPESPLKRGVVITITPTRHMSYNDKPNVSQPHRITGAASVTSHKGLATCSAIAVGDWQTTHLKVVAQTRHCQHASDDTRAHNLNSYAESQNPSLSWSSAALDTLDAPTQCARSNRKHPAAPTTGTHAEHDTQHPPLSQNVRGKCENNGESPRSQECNAVDHIKASRVTHPVEHAQTPSRCDMQRQALPWEPLLARQAFARGSKTPTTMSNRSIRHLHWAHWTHSVCIHALRTGHTHSATPTIGLQLHTLHAIRHPVKM